jgi:type I restriction enzyme S subunit
MSIEFKYVPLTFISTRNAIEEQLRNTVVFKKVIDEYQNCVPLGELIISTQYGFTASAKSEGSHRLLRITDINNGKVNWDTVPKCDCDRPQNYTLNEGDVLIARTGNNISFLVDSDVPNNSVFASYLIRIICDKSKILPEYLYLFLNSYAFWPQILLKQRGALLQNVNASLMKQLLIPMCSLNEQKEIINNIKTNLTLKISEETEKIVSLFNDKNDISYELTHQLDLIKQMRQAFLREAMQGKLVKSTNTKETGQQLLAKIKAEKAKLIADKKLKKEKELLPISEDAIPFEIPKHWAWCRFQDITKVITCGLASTPTYRKEGRMFLSAKNIKPFRFMPENFKYVDEETYRKVTQNAKPEINDILITRVGAGIGETAIIDKEIDFAYYVSLTLVKPFNKISSNYLQFWLNSPTGIQSAISFTTGSGSSQGNLNVEKVRSFLIPIPPFHEQEQIVAKLEELMAFCDGLEQSIKESQGYNEMLLQQVLREALKGGEK